MSENDKPGQSKPPPKPSRLDHGHPPPKAYADLQEGLPQPEHKGMTAQGGGPPPPSKPPPRSPDSGTSATPPPKSDKE